MHNFTDTNKTTGEFLNRLLNNTFRFVEYLKTNIRSGKMFPRVIEEKHREELRSFWPLYHRNRSTPRPALCRARNVAPVS
jgi:hypothetical protein